VRLKCVEESIILNVDPKGLGLKGVQNGYGLMVLVVAEYVYDVRGSCLIDKKNRPSALP